MDTKFRIMTPRDWAHLVREIVLFSLILAGIGLLGMLIFEFKFDVKSVLNDKKIIQDILKTFLIIFTISSFFLIMLTVIMALPYPCVEFQENGIKYKSRFTSYMQFNKVKVIIYKAMIGMRCPGPTIILLQNDHEVERIKCYDVTIGMKNILKELKLLNKDFEINLHDLLKSKITNKSLDDILQTKFHFFR